MSRADRFSLEAKKQEVYSDFMNNFDQNPITGLLAKVTNEVAIGQAMKNLALTMKGERFYDAEKGSTIPQSLFDFMDFTDAEILKAQLKEMYRTYEPRAIINDIRVRVNENTNSSEIVINYSTINIPDEQFTVNFIVKVAR